MKQNPKARVDRLDQRSLRHLKRHWDRLGRLRALRKVKSWLLSVALDSFEGKQ